MSDQAHTDWLTFTVPYSESSGLDQVVLNALRPVFPTARKGTTDVYEIGVRGKFMGSLWMKAHRPVYVVSLSGVALEIIRGKNCLTDLLEVFRRRDHRITKLDAAVDLYGVEGPQFVTALEHKARRTPVRIGQRRAPIEVRFGNDARGAWTGTVYLGGKSARVSLRVYDKRHERECAGDDDPGPWVRAELTFRGGDQGVPLSFQEVLDPTALFWAHMPRAVLAPQGEVPPWVPCTDPAGFVLPARQARDPDRELREWAQRFGWQGVDLADACGPSGRRRLALMLNLLSHRELRETPFVDPESQDIPF